MKTLADKTYQPRFAGRVCVCRRRIACAWLAGCLCLPLPAAAEAAACRSLQVELSGQEHNAIKTSWPGIGCWFWTAQEFKPEGYKLFLDQHARHSAFKLLTTSIRYPAEVSDPKVHDQIKAAAVYARSLGMGIVMELDAPFARILFAEKYPDELQGLVRLRDVVLQGVGEVSLAVEPLNGGTHGFYTKGFDSVAGRLLRVYSYSSGAQGIESVEDITGRCKVDQADALGVKVTIPCTEKDRGRTACVMARFDLLTPDMFSPNLADFELQVLRQYADVPLAGVCKDEWGFCPSSGNSITDLWFSNSLAKQYARRRSGHELLRDLLLMSKGEKGRTGERAAAVNHYMEMYWQRNAEIETKYYHAIKQVFGNDAMVGTHPTWWPYPNTAEVFKNGLDWWAVKRDLAQTDEVTPFCVRTALAKKWHSPLWYNMYYGSSAEPYAEDLWRHALGGGRMNFHPLFPGGSIDEIGVKFLPAAGKLLRADCRVRLLNYISTAPIDCPVAIVFSLPRVANWADPGTGDAGVAVCDALWKDGYYADLIPSSEIEAGALKLAADGRIQYGPQTYAAVVFYQPQYERPSAGEFFRKAAATGKTALYRIGDWTMDFDGNPVDARTLLPAAMTASDAATCTAAIIAQLKASGCHPQTPCTMRTHSGFNCPSMMPKPNGQCRLLDGTVILASGEKDVRGDPIQKTIHVDGQEVAFDAVGVAAVRLDKEGKLEALAAGGLKRFAVGNTKIDLPQRIDVALWKDTKGVWQGVLQDYEGEVPKDLAALCKHWTRLQVPEPLKE